MSRSRSVLLILLLLAGSLSPPGLHAQAARDGPPPTRTPAFRLEQNFPNPVNPETWIAFFLDDSLFEGGDTVLVTMRIYNMLQHVVAIPTLVEQRSGERIRLSDLIIREPGRRIAYWDGKDQAGRRVPTGIYYCQLVVNGQPRIVKMSVINERRRDSPFPWFGGRRRPNDRP